MWCKPLQIVVWIKIYQSWFEVAAYSHNSAASLNKSRHFMPALMQPICSTPHPVCPWSHMQQVQVAGGEVVWKHEISHLGFGLEKVSWRPATRSTSSLMSWRRELGCYGSPSSTSSALRPPSLSLPYKRLHQSWRGRGRRLPLELPCNLCKTFSSSSRLLWFTWSTE